MEKIKTQLNEYDQSHLLNFYQELNVHEQHKLLEQLQSIDFGTMIANFEESLQVLDEQETIYNKEIEPVPISEFGSALTCGDTKLKEYWDVGIKEIADKKIAALALAGGQGTRLGLNIPKGLLQIGLPSGKTILQLHIERIKRLQEISKKFTKKNPIIPLYIMTSEATHNDIDKYLNDNNYFELDVDDIILFKQGMNPCFTLDGKIIMSQKCCVSMAPDGTGGLYKAMEKNGIFDDMEKRGIKYIHVYPVDNVMVKVTDPIFIGYCTEVETDCAAKVLKKHKATQNVGNICKIDGLYSLVEYSEISDELAASTDDKGELLFHSGSICIHMFSLDFMKEMALKNLKPHVAKKRVPFVDEKGHIRCPQMPNAIKIERFVFEAFKYAKNFVTWEVGYDEFSPIKNPNKEKYECPLTAKTDLLSMHKSYVEKYGAVVEHAEVEISPLISYCGEDLNEIVNNFKFLPYSSTHIQNEEEYYQNQVDITFKSFSQLFKIKPTMILDG